MQHRTSLRTGFAVHSHPPTAASPNPTKLLKIGLATVLVAAALVRGGPARADIWGYVDATGRAHMASEKIDDRYQLFFKGTQKVGGPASPASAAPSASPAAVAGVDAATTETFRQSARFIRTSTQSNVKRFEPIIERTAKAHRLDPALIKAVVAVESSFQPDAVSPKGARGLMQVIPDTAERYGVVGDRKQSAAQKLLDPATNLRVGIAHLSNLMSMFAANLELALAAYNAGEGAVLKYAKKIPPYPETQEYVKLVKQFYAGFLPPSKAQPAAAKMMLAANAATPAAIGSPASDAQLAAAGLSARSSAASAASAAASSAAVAATAVSSPVSTAASATTTSTIVPVAGAGSSPSTSEQPKPSGDAPAQAANG
jgi:soluble lytic murein transglycosylase-like protein